MRYTFLLSIAFLIYGTLIAAFPITQSRNTEIHGYDDNGAAISLHSP